MLVFYLARDLNQIINIKTKLLLETGGTAGLAAPTGNPPYTCTFNSLINTLDLLCSSFTQTQFECDTLRFCGGVSYSFLTGCRNSPEPHHHSEVARQPDKHPNDIRCKLVKLSAELGVFQSYAKIRSAKLRMSWLNDPTEWM